MHIYKWKNRKQGGGLWVKDLRKFEAYPQYVRLVLLAMAAMPQNVTNGSREEKIKTTERVKGGRVIDEEENTLKDTDNWSDIKYISVEKVGGK